MGRAGADHAAADGRFHPLGHDRHHPRRPHRLCAVLQSAVLHPASRRDFRTVEGRHVVSWRLSRLRRRGDPVLPQEQPADPVARRHHHRGRADRAVSRADRQFHQQRIVGPAGRSQPALGDGISQWRAAAAPSEPALRGGARGYRAVYDPGRDDPDRRLEAAGPDPRQLHRDLRSCAYHRRIFPGARPAAWIFVGRADHGHAAVGADDHCRSDHYCGGMAPQGAERKQRHPFKECRDRIFAAAVRDQEADQVVRPDAGLALHGAVPDASQARLLRFARSAGARGRFHHRARSEPDVRRIARAVGGLGVEGDRFAVRCCG